MAERALRDVGSPAGVRWLREHYADAVAGSEDLKARLLARLTDEIEQGRGEALEALRDFLVQDRALVDLLARDYEYNLKASLVVRMALHRFIQPADARRQVALNVVEILKTAYFLSNPSCYVEVGPGGADPALLYPEASYPVGATLLVSEGPARLAPNPYEPPAAPYALAAPPTALGRRCVVYLDHSPDNNKKLVALLRERGTTVLVMTSPAEFTGFVSANYAAVVELLARGDGLRVICDRQFATDFAGDGTGVDILAALGGMGLTGVRVLVYCWRVELVAHLAQAGVAVTKDVKVARRFGCFEPV